MRATLALARKDLLVTARSPLLAVLSVLVPVAFTMLYAIVIHVSTTAPIAVAKVDRSPQAPVGFSRGQSIDVTTYNINTDTMKNVRLRLVTVANRYDAENGHQQVTSTIIKAKPQDVSRTAFMGGGAIILALLLGSCLIAANLFAMEQEIRTTKELVLTPLGALVGALGAAAAGALLALLAAVPTAAMAVAFGFRTDLAGLTRSAVVIGPAMVGAAGLGVLTAQLLRTHRAIQPTIILLALGTYFAAGGFIPVPGLPPTARAFAALWPPSYVFEWTNPLLHGFSHWLTASQLLAVLAAAVLGVGLAIVAGLRQGRRSTTSGQ